MNHIVLNDLVYDFQPVEMFVPDPNYKVNEEELKKSREKNKALVSFAFEYINNIEADSSGGNE